MQTIKIYRVVCLTDGASSSKQQKLDSATNGIRGAEKTKLTNGRYDGGQQTNGIAGQKSKLTNGKVDDKKKYRSVQDDPNASKAYKSLFSSSKEAKEKGTAHWVTHNPFYN